MPVDIAPITIDVVVATSQLSVVDAQQVQNRDVQVITPRCVFRRLASKLIALAATCSPLMPPPTSQRNASRAGLSDDEDRHPGWQV